MSNEKAALAIVIMSAVTVLIRFAPFVLLSGRETPKAVAYLGKVLPGAIMAMLVVYCLRSISFSGISGFLPELIAGIVVVGSYVWRRNTLMSIIAGTVCYMLLVRLVFV